VAAFAERGSYEPNVARLRETYRSRRDALVAGLREALPDATFEVPAGGYFVWLGLPDELDSGTLVASAVEGGVSFVPGRRFDVAGSLGGSWLRTSFARYREDLLVEAAARLGRVVDAARRSR
jgi:DNA-binding transcriptional MocR family regulator